MHTRPARAGNAEAMTPRSKDELFEAGKDHIFKWCTLNGGVNSCAAMGYAGRQWSWPGYIVDRTPFGVLAHELGHHVEGAHGAKGGQRSHVWRPLDTKPLTSYCPDDNEWFAELFRLFVTNPDLFQALRPKIAHLFKADWGNPVETRPWREVLGIERQIRAAENRVARGQS